jgi:hypothetical protein
MQVPFFRPPLAPLQFVEQHSEPNAHASPRVVHAAPACATHFEPKPQSPEQHCVSLAQDWSIWRQALDEHVPFVQVREQHCSSDPHGSPGYAHIPPSSRQLPVELHAPEQHCESRLQPAPGSRHTTVVGVPHWFEALQ